MLFFVVLLTPVILFTIVVIFDPFKWHWLQPRKIPQNYLKHLSNPQIDKAWDDASKRLSLVETFLRSNNAKTGAQEIKSYWNAIEAIQEIGINLIAQSITPLEKFVGIALRDSYNPLRKNIVGEEGQGFQAQVMQEIPLAIHKLTKSIESRNASSVFLALSDFNLVVNTGQTQTKIPSRLIKKERKAFVEGVNKLIADHFKIGNYQSLDNFILEWKERSKVSLDSQIFIFISIISASLNKRNLAALRGALSRQREQDKETDPRYTPALLIIKAIEEYSKALQRNDSLAVYRSTYKIMQEIQNLDL